MFTTDFFFGLFDNAKEAMRLYREDGQHGRLNYSALDLLASKAVACSQYMIEQGIDAAPVVGPFGIMPVRAGDRVFVKKGALIKSTRLLGGFVSKRRYAVTIHRVNLGYVQDFRPKFVSPPEIVWAGSGGYWMRTRLDNVELSNGPTASPSHSSEAPV